MQWLPPREVCPTLIPPNTVCVGFWFFGQAPKWKSHESVYQPAVSLKVDSKISPSTEGPQNHTSLADSQQRPVSGLEVRLAETHSKSKSVQSPEGCQSSLSQESHWKESSRSRKRLSQAAAKTLICENNLHEDSQGLWPAKRSQSFAPQHSGTRPSTASWSNSCLLSAVPAPCLTKKKTKDL